MLCLGFLNIHTTELLNSKINSSESLFIKALCSLMDMTLVSQQMRLLK